MNIPAGAGYRLKDFNQRSAFALAGMTQYLRLRQERKKSHPGISAVMVGRNDDYMPDFIRRLEATIRWNTYWLVDEVIFVEWNPPANRPLLAPELAKEFENLRAYVVSAAVHESLCENPHLPLLEYHAKNVGIRRAKSPWVIATNADIAFGTDTALALRDAALLPKVAWTAQRVDIPWQESRAKPIGLLDSLRYRRIIPYGKLGTGDFIMASRDLWEQTRGYDEALTRHRIGCDVRGSTQMLSFGAEISRAGTVLHLTHPTSCTEKVQPHHGEYAPLDGLPYRNPATWGLYDRQETQLSERVWQLE